MTWSKDSVAPALTQRERQVLELVARGYSAKEIAGKIGIAPRTVEGHVETVRLKVRARNKAHMVTQAILSGVLNVAPGADDKGQILLWPEREPDAEVDANLVAVRNP